MGKHELLTVPTLTRAFVDRPAAESLCCSARRIWGQLHQGTGLGVWLFGVYGVCVGVGRYSPSTKSWLVYFGVLHFLGLIWIWQRNCFHPEETKPFSSSRLPLPRSNGMHREGWGRKEGRDLIPVPRGLRGRETIGIYYIRTLRGLRGLLQTLDGFWNRHTLHSMICTFR